MSLLDTLRAARPRGRKQFALLLDPDKLPPAELPERAQHAQAAGVDLLLVGGSLLTTDRAAETVLALKAHCALPVVLFPGSPLQVVPGADAVLLLSLISGRNPELLIGQHVLAAPRLQKLEQNGLEILSTGYLLVDGGRPTSASYVSGTQPLPHDKPELAAYTALAGQYLGLQALYLDAGSGAERAVSPEMVRAVRQLTTQPLFVGGGLRTPEAVAERLAAGADVAVVGTALESEPEALAAFVGAVKAGITL